jgi:hypothetical protein
MTDPSAPAPPPLPLYGAPLYGAPYGPPTGVRNGFGLAALVLGIATVLLFWVPFVGVVLGLLAVVFAVLGRSRVRRAEASNGGVVVAGLVTGLVGLVLAGIMTAFVVANWNELLDYSQCVNDAAGNKVVEKACEQQLTDRLGF